MNWREDKTLFILAFFTIFFTLVVLAVVTGKPDDGQTFSTFTTLLAGFAGALTRHLTGDPHSAPPGSTTFTKTDQVIVTPEPEKKP